MIKLFLYIICLTHDVLLQPVDNQDFTPLREEKDPDKISLKHSIAYHFVRHTRSVEADIFVSRKINLSPITDGLNTIQDVEERISDLCEKIPSVLKKAKTNFEEAELKRPKFHFYADEGQVGYWPARKRCESQGLQLPEIYTEQANHELMEFMRDNKILTTFAGTFFDPYTLVHRFVSTGIPIWGMYHKHLNFLESDETIKLISWKEACINPDTKFLYTQKGEVVVYYEGQRGVYKLPTPRYDSLFQQGVASVVCQAKWKGEKPIRSPNPPEGWTSKNRIVPEYQAKAVKVTYSSHKDSKKVPSKREVAVETTPLQDFCYSVTRHMSETLERSSTRLASLLSLVDISIDAELPGSDKVKRDYGNLTDSEIIESEITGNARLSRDLLKNGKRLYKVGKTINRLNRAGPLFALTTGFRAVWSLFGFVEKIRTDRRLKSLERAVARNNEAIDQLSKEVASHSIAIDELSLVTQELTQKLEALTSRVDNLEARVAAIETEIKIQQILSFIDSLVERTQSALEYGFVKLESIIHNALASQASAYLLPPDKLQDIQVQLSKETSSLIDGDYSRMRSVVVAHPEDHASLLAIVNLAALSRKSKELVQLTAMPTFKDGVALLPQLDYHSVLLNQEEGTFTVIEENELANCLTDHCITSNPEVQVISASCGIPQLFDRQLETCAYDETTSDGLFLRRLMSDGVIFSVREETRAQVFCESQTSRVYQVTGMGTVNLPAGCNLVMVNKPGKTAKINSLPISRAIGFEEVNLIVAGPEQIFRQAANVEPNGTSTLSKMIESHIDQLNQKLDSTDTALSSQHRNVVILGSFLAITLMLCFITSALAYRYSQRFRMKVRLVKEEVRSGFEQATEKLRAFENRITQKANDDFASSFPLLGKQAPEVPPQSLNVLLYKLERLEERIAQSEGYLSLSNPGFDKKEEIYQNTSEVHYVSSPRAAPRLYPPIPAPTDLNQARATLARVVHRNLEPSAPESRSPMLPPKEGKSNK